MIDEDLLLAKIEQLRTHLIRGACASQTVFETHCKEEAYDEVVTVINSMRNIASSKDLKEEIQRYLNDCLDLKFPTRNSDQIKTDVVCTARHFAEWQREKMVKELQEVRGVGNFLHQR